MTITELFSFEKMKIIETDFSRASIDDEYQMV